VLIFLSLNYPPSIRRKYEKLVDEKLQEIYAIQRRMLTVRFDKSVSNADKERDLKVKKSNTFNNLLFRGPLLSHANICFLQPNIELGA
jgi:hypothetical protein